MTFGTEVGRLQGLAEAGAIWSVTWSLVLPLATERPRPVHVALPPARRTDHLGTTTTINGATGGIRRQPRGR